MTLHLSPEHIEAIRRHGERAFPHECCGLLLGDIELRESQEHKRIMDLWQVDNTWESAENPVADGESSQRRFLIEPADFKRGYDAARERGLGVVGTYHSHPNHPAIPSDFDRQHAFPWGYSCAIVSVMEGQAADLRSWILDDSDRCVEQPIESGSPQPPASTPPDVALTEDSTVASGPGVAV